MIKNNLCYKVTAALLLVAMAIPLASCSIFARKEIIEAAD